jgi:hypothetical protein
MRSAVVSSAKVPRLRPKDANLTAEFLQWIANGARGQIGVIVLPAAGEAKKFATEKSRF